MELFFGRAVPAWPMLERGKSIHRKLIIRLSLMAVAVSIIAGMGAALSEQKNMRELAVERALQASSYFTTMVARQLNSSDWEDRARIQQALDKFSEGRVRLPKGNFVLARILNKDFLEVARVSDPAYEHVSAIAKYAESHTNRSAMDETVCATVIRIDRLPIVRVLFPLDVEGRKSSAYGDAFFAISPETLREERWRVARTSGSAVAIVLLTTLILYPVIRRLLGQVSSLAVNLLDANIETLNILGSAIAKRDSDTDIHNYRVTIYSVRLAERLGINDDVIRVLIKGAFLHDVGKIGISDSILLKRGRLTEAEFEEMKKHVTHGLDIVSRSKWLHDAAVVVGSHQEKYDGTGYTRGLAGPDIPLPARIFAIADVFDALTSRRPYKEPFGLEQTIEILMQERGTHFEPELVDAFFHIAKSLYDEYANRDDEKPRLDAEKIVARYFNVDLATLMKREQESLKNSCAH